MSRLVFLFGLLLSTSLCIAEATDSIVPDPPRETPKETPKSLPKTPEPVATDPSYHLSPGDEVTVTVQGELDLSRSEYLDYDGTIRLPLLDHVRLGGLTVREAVQFLERKYVENELLKSPVVYLVVVNYAPREVLVTGAVRKPGPLLFPKEVTSLDIVDVITLAGDFLPTAKKSSVTVTRRKPDGTENTTTVDVQSMMTPRDSHDRVRPQFAIFPGDRIIVSEKLF